MSHIRSLSLLAGIIVVFTCGVVQAEVKDAIVKIYAVSNKFNYHDPWQMLGQKSFHGSGSIIAGNRILTNAHVVSNHTHLQVRLAGQTQKYTAKLEVVSHAADLAILSVDDEHFFTGVTPLQLGELADFRDKVEVYGFPAGGDKLSITEGIVSRVEHVRYNHSSAYLLACQMDASINSGNSGGPVLKDDRIVGVAFQVIQGGSYENIGYMVPSPRIKHFLQDYKDGRLDGIPEIGMTMQRMENPDLRRRFQLGADQTGVLVNWIHPDSPVAGKVSLGDVLMAIDGYPIANDGTIAFRARERTYLGHIFQNKQLNAGLTLDLLRGRQKKQVSIELNRSLGFERLVPNEQYDAPPTYFILGGLVFVPLTKNYLKEYGGPVDWAFKAPHELMQYYINAYPSRPDQRVIVLVKVLADDINTGYHERFDNVVVAVNDQPVNTMRGLIKAFETNVGTYHTIKMKRNYQIVLSKENVDRYGARILEKYRIGRDRSANLSEP